MADSDNILKVDDSSTIWEDTILYAEDGDALMIDVYVPPEPPLSETLKLAQGPAKLANREDLAKDRDGITNPNLHRRIDVTIGVAPSIDAYLLTTDDYYITTEDDFCIVMCVSDESSKYSYDYHLTVGGLNSFRTTNLITHDEESTTSEVP